MKQVQRILVIGLVAILFFSSFANPIKCYQCTSVNDTRCLNVKADNSSEELNKNCTGNYHGKQPFCRKTVLTIIDNVRIQRIHRSCGWEEDNINSKPCYKYENDFHSEFVCVCSEDGCNTASLSLAPTAPFIVAVVSIITLALR